MATRQGLLFRKSANVGRRLALENCDQPPIPELHRGFLLRVVTVAIVDAGDVFLVGMIEDAADDESRDTAGGHQARGGPTQIMSADVRPITGRALRLDPGDDVGPGALRKTSPDVFVVAQERLRKHPYSPLGAGHTLYEPARDAVQIDTMPVCVLHEF